MSNNSFTNWSTDDLKYHRASLPDSLRHEANREYASWLPDSTHWHTVETRPDRAPQARGYLRSKGYDV